MTEMAYRVIYDSGTFCFLCLAAILFIFGAIIYLPSVFGQANPITLPDQITQLQNTTASTTSLYKNSDFGFITEYPTSWIFEQDNLRLNTIAAFSLIHTNIYDFTNSTLAEIDIRVFNNGGNVSAENLTLSDIGSAGEIILNSSRSTLGGLPALKIVDYTFDGITTKHMQVWTVLPENNLRLLIYYIAQPSFYDQYLPVMQHVLDSFKLTK
jgi:hypothetical protein